MDLPVDLFLRVIEYVIWIHYKWGGGGGGGGGGDIIINVKRNLNKKI